MRIQTLAFVLAAAVLAVGGQAAPDASQACPSPKPLPASVKRPPTGANATQLANFLLALPQRKPCDVSLFTSKFIIGDRVIAGLYPTGQPMAPAAGPVPTEQGVRSQLSVFLKGSPHRAFALDLYDQVGMKAKIPDPTLRAALVSLRGTVAEAVIEDFRSREYGNPPRFQAMPWNVVGAATGPDLKRAILFNPRYPSEHFALFTGIFAHEVLHHDMSAPPTEEVILNTLSAIVHMQVLSRQPELATSGTELSRRMNDLVLVLVNSRVPDSSRSAIIAPKGQGTAPGSAGSQRDLWGHGKDFHLMGFSANPSDSSPAPPVFGAVLRRILAPGVAIPKPLTYSKKTAELFSRLNDTWLSPVDRLRVSVLLGLVSMDEITAYTGLSREKAISMFRLAPILAVMK
jgi:hypothetical protein